MNTFCVLPWFSREIDFNNNETHCCLLPRNYNIDNIKTQMLANQRPAECQKCWNLEDQGIRSDRQVKNDSLDFYWNRDLAAIYEAAKTNRADQILILKLTTSVICNATCISCNDMFSSSWQNLKHQINPVIPLKNYKSIDINCLLEQVDFSKLIMLSFVGGEPLYEKRNFELLERMIELGNTQTFISIVTNGSVSLTDRQKRILAQFKNLNFSVSIDGTGPVFEYLRYPLKWDHLIDNLDFFKEITDNISSNYTISNLNIFYHNQTISWFNQENIVFSKSPVYYPAWLSPKSLPTNFKNILKSKLPNDDYQLLVGNTHTYSDQNNFNQMLLEIRKQDQAKNIHMRNYLPELADLINYS